MATRKVRIQEKTGASSTDLLHPETEAGVVTYSNTSSGLTATNVQDAIDEVLTSAGAVDDVQNGSGTSLVSNKIATVIPSAIGAEAAFTDGSATIASETNNVVTIKAGVTQSGGAISNSSASDIVLGTAAKKDATTSVTQNSTDLVTSGAVWTAIDNMPEPMVFKGSLGTGGTITSLPAASSANEGFTYKVITAGTYASQSADIGDTFISTGSEWVLIPSGDEPSGTVTSVGADTASGSHLSFSGNPVTSSGTLTLSVDSGYSIPSDTNQSSWTAKYDKPSGGIPDTDLSSGVQTSLGKADSALQENQTITISGDASGSGKTSIAVTLANSGVTAGTYSAVTVDAKGRATSGYQSLEYGSKSGTNTPSNNLVTGGLFFEEI